MFSISVQEKRTILTVNLVLGGGGGGSRVNVIRSCKLVTRASYLSFYRVVYYWLLA